MTAMERRIRTEMRYWAANVAALVAIGVAACARNGLVAIAFLVVFGVLQYAANKQHRKLMRLDDEADRVGQEEWT